MRGEKAFPAFVLVAPHSAAATGCDAKLEAVRTQMIVFQDQKSAIGVFFTSPFLDLLENLPITSIVYPVRLGLFHQIKPL
jgi:hypothetical protein